MAVRLTEPHLVYEYDTMNIVWAVIFSETIIVPAIVILDCLQCSVREKPEK